MTDSEALWYFQVAFLILCCSFAYVFGYFEGRISAFKKVADDTREDARRLLQLYPRER